MMLIFYKLPYDIEQKYTASTLDGEKIEIQMTMKGYRDFFRPTTFKGKMLIDDKVYDVFEPERSDRFIAKMKKKMNGDRYFPIIANENRTDLDDYYTIQWANDKFNTLYFIHAKNNSRYVAPAQNAVEANKIWGEIQHFLR
ncbi:hypothetical protein [Paenibacillus polysaccharolyticus]|nr:hypothetical protein [Paenibacillus polysaccharolyticus]